MKWGILVSLLNMYGFGFTMKMHSARHLKLNEDNPSSVDLTDS